MWKIFQKRFLPNKVVKVNDMPLIFNQILLISLKIPDVDFFACLWFVTGDRDFVRIFSDKFTYLLVWLDDCSLSDSTVHIT